MKPTRIRFLVMAVIAGAWGAGPALVHSASAPSAAPPAAAEQQLTFDDAIEYAPSFSPDGRTISYARTVTIEGKAVTKIWSMDLDGRHPRRLTATDNTLDEWTPMWSPDGTSLAWCSGRSGNLDNWKVDRAGKVHTQLTTAAEADNFPIWRRDGKQIAFMSEREGHSAIWVMNPDGSQPVKVSRRETGDLGVSWSPDGNRLAYVSTQNPQGAFHAGAWVILHHEPPAHGVIVVQDVKTGEVKQLTTGEHRDWYPMWSPTEDKIAFISDRSGNWDLWVMNADGSSPVQLTSNPGLDKEPFWSPDGRSIVYVSQRNGRWDVWRLDVERALRQPQTASTAHPSQP